MKHFIFTVILLFALANSVVAQDVQKLIKQKLPQDLWELAGKFTIPDAFLKERPTLVELVLRSRSLDTNEEKQNWFNIYPLMTEDQKNKLDTILTTEKKRLEEIEEKYAQKKREIKEKYLTKWSLMQGFSSIQEDINLCKRENGENSPECEKFEYEKYTDYADSFLESAKQLYADSVNLDSAIVQYKNAYEMYEYIILKERKFYKPNITKAFENMNESNFRAGFIKDKKRQKGAAVSTIADIEYQKRLVDAFEFVLISNNIFDKEQLIQSLVFAYANLSGNYMDLKRFDDALIYAKKARETFFTLSEKKQEDQHTKDYVKKRLAYAYIFTNNYDQAVPLFKEVKESIYEGAHKEFRGRPQKDFMLFDLEVWEKDGVSHPDFVKVRKLLKE